LKIDHQNREIWIYKRSQCCHPIRVTNPGLSVREDVIHLFRPHLPIF
jgi:hypothetical protein